MCTRRELITTGLKMGIALGAASIVGQAENAMARMPGEIDWSRRITDGPSKTTMAGGNNSYYQDKVLTQIKNGTYDGPQTPLFFWNLGQSQSEALSIAKTKATGEIKHENGVETDEYYNIKDINKYSFSMEDDLKCTVTLLFYNKKLISIQLWEIKNDADSILLSLAKKYGPAKKTTCERRGEGIWWDETGQKWQTQNDFCTRVFDSTDNQIYARFDSYKAKEHHTKDYYREMWVIQVEAGDIKSALKKAYRSR